MIESFTLHEAAAFLKIHPDTCARMTKAGLIPGCKIGRAWVYHKGVLDEYLRNKCGEAVTANAHFRRVGGFTSALTAERLAARRAQVIAGKISGGRRRKEDIPKGD
jgi:excisionase family DNA binding protein